MIIETQFREELDRQYRLWLKMNYKQDGFFQYQEFLTSLSKPTKPNSKPEKRNSTHMSSQGDE